MERSCARGLSESPAHGWQLQREQASVDFGELKQGRGAEPLAVVAGPGTRKENMAAEA